MKINKKDILIETNILNTHTSMLAKIIFLSKQENVLEKLCKQYSS